MRISRFFAETLGAQFVNHVWSWGAERESDGTLFLRVWDDSGKQRFGQECFLLVNHEWNFRSAGYPERIRHVNQLERGALGFGVLCKARRGSDGDRIAIESFDSDTLLEFGEIISDGPRRYAAVARRIDVSQLSSRIASHDNLLGDLTKLNATLELGATEREALLHARVGQGGFRMSVLSSWEHRCCVTGARTLEAVRASHIKPWRCSNDAERLDPHNGLPLIATLDALFDAGLVTFSDRGELRVSRALPCDERKYVLPAEAGLRKELDQRSIPYLEFHREHVFQR